jgi:hypothetical protein
MRRELESPTTMLGRVLLLVSCAALSVTACGSDQKPPTAPRGIEIGVMLPDFELVDVNPNSATSGQAISPHRYRGAISAWYFGHAT